MQLYHQIHFYEATNAHSTWIYVQKHNIIEMYNQCIQL